jgi:hypothetical protein
MKPKLLYLAVAVAVLCLPACDPVDKPGKCQTGDAFPYTAPYDMEFCPNDIQAWMDRTNGCAHFAGEEPYDAERGKFLNEQMDKLRCNDIGCDFQALFLKYEGDIVYTGILTGYAEATFGNVDNLPFCPPTQNE